MREGVGESWIKGRQKGEGREEEALRRQERDTKGGED